jgi:hypothetical protein
MLPQFDPLILDIVSAALGDAVRREAAEAGLARLESAGWRLSGAVQAIWEGERDPVRLAHGLDDPEARLVAQILELLSEYQPQESSEAPAQAPNEAISPELAELVMRLPIHVRLAVLDGDAVALQQALAALPPEQAGQVLQELLEAGVLEAQAQDERQQALSELEPLLQAVASAAQASPEGREPLRDFLAHLEGDGWRLSEPIERLWAGERDLGALTQGLSQQEALAVEKILALLA